MKTLKILKIAFVLAFTIQIGLTAVIATTPQAARAEDPTPLEYEPQIKIPVTGSGLDKATTTIGSYNSATGKMDSDLLARYIKAFYSYGMAVAGILATIVLMGAGVLWLTSAGNDSKITQAKELIAGSVVGLGILFGSWILLNTINPDLLNMKIISTQLARPAYFNESGFISNLEDLPTDMTYGWVCMNSSSQTCADSDPPTINLDQNICNTGKPGNAKPTNCPYGQLWCCGKSASDVQKSNICIGKDNGTSCRLNSTAGLGSGYCLSNKCEPCKITGTNSDSEGAPCTNHYQCKSTNTRQCGDVSHGFCFCNLAGENCTCRFSQPLW